MENNFAVHAGLELLRTLLEDKGFIAIKSGAAKPLPSAIDSKDREWRYHGKRVTKNMHAGNMPEVRMARLGTAKKGESIWVKWTAFDEPGIELKGTYKEKAVSEGVLFGETSELPLEVSERFIHNHL